MSKAALELFDVHKRYGRRVALDGLTLRIPRGSVSGLVGPNGAGKTTCFSVAAGLVRAQTGRVSVLEQGPYDPANQRGLLGLLPQDAELTPHTRVGTQLRYLAQLAGMSSAEARRDTDRVLELVSLRDRRDARMGELSHGMKRRVAVAQALLGTPALVLLDEPTAGLDPHLVKHMRDVIREENRVRGVTFVVSSHVLSELEAMCDHAVFLERGRAMQSGPLSELLGRKGTVRVRVARMPEAKALEQSLESLSYDIEGDELVVRVPENQSLELVNERVLGALLTLRAGVLEVTLGATLERAYLTQRRAWVQTDEAP